MFNKGDIIKSKLSDNTVILDIEKENDKVNALLFTGSIYADVKDLKEHEDGVVRWENGNYDKDVRNLLDYKDAINTKDNEIDRGSILKTRMNDRTVVLDFDAKNKTAVLLASPTFIFAKKVELSDNNELKWDKAEYSTDLQKVLDAKVSYDKFIDELRPVEHNLHSLNNKTFNVKEVGDEIKGVIEPTVPLVFNQEKDKITIESEVTEKNGRPKFHVEFPIEIKNEEVKLGAVKLLNNNVKNVFLDDINTKKLEEYGFTKDKLLSNIKDNEKGETTNGRTYITNENKFNDIKFASYNISTIDRALKDPKVPEKTKESLKVKIKEAVEKNDVRKLKSIRESIDKDKTKENKNRER